jgi:hypothetical protein
MQSLFSIIENSLLEANELAKMKLKVENHIQRVIFFYKKMLQLGLIPKEDQNLKEVLKHDADKLLPSNLKKQAKRLQSDFNDDDYDDIADVVNNHIKDNPHHLEYWDDNADFWCDSVNVSKMPDKYLYEMIADWHATAEEKGNSVIDYMENMSWKFHFTKEQKKTIKKCAKALAPYIDKSFEMHYDDALY